MNLTEIIKSLKNLPPAPTVLPKLLRILNDDNAFGDDVVELINLDPSLTAQIIRMSNSAYYAGGGTITDLGQAVNRLGFKEIYRTVTVICAKSFVGAPVESYQIDGEERWFNSVATGLVMELLAEKLSTYDSSTAYTLGLLHDIGKLAMNQLHGESYIEVLKRIEGGRESLPNAEIDAFGYNHAELGAALLQEWGFADEMIEPIRYQYEPYHSNEFKKYTAMLHLSHWIVAGIGGNPGKNAWAFMLDEGVLETLSINQDSIMSLMLDAREDMKLKEDFLAL